ncbi:hypothetical protein [Paenibacillus albiflavus]|uniref:hypothetical protein n=1 Tax=Paenibacillus albiflavus TaxID=2545760 RepID=UPI001404A735|nr:hypothetical protein [Paenibacillus albiflavus]
MKYALHAVNSALKNYQAASELYKLQIANDFVKNELPIVYEEMLNAQKLLDENVEDLNS